MSDLFEHSPRGPVILWSDHRDYYEGWSPRSFATVTEALEEAKRHGDKFVITALVTVDA